METVPDTAPPEPKIHCIFTPSTRTWCYVVADRATGHAVIIDPVLSRESSGTIGTPAPDAILALVNAENYTVDHILETNAYDEHHSAVWYLRTQLLETTGRAPRIAVRKSLKIVQRLYARKYGVRNKFWAGEFDGQFVDGEVLTAGNMQIRVIHLPGRSEDHVGYKIAKNLFCGDCCFHTLHQSDLPGLTQERLRRSINTLQGLAADVRISTTKGCPAKADGSGCIAETREQHAARHVIEDTGTAGGLDQGLVV